MRPVGYADFDEMFFVVINFVLHFVEQLVKRFRTCRHVESLVTELRTQENINE